MCYMWPAAYVHSTSLFRVNYPVSTCDSANKVGVAYTGRSLVNSDREPDAFRLEWKAYNGPTLLRPFTVVASELTAQAT